MRPIRRTERLVVREVDDQSIVYDLDSEQVTCLDPQTSAVFAVCTGTDLASVGRATGLTEAAVAASLVRLTEAGLLEEPSVTRRALVRRWGSAAALAPLVTIAAPAAIAAASTHPPPSFTLIVNPCVSTGPNNWDATVDVMLTDFTAGQSVLVEIWYATTTTGKRDGFGSPTIGSSGQGSVTFGTKLSGSNTTKDVRVKVTYNSTVLPVQPGLINCRPA